CSCAPEAARRAHRRRSAPGQRLTHRARTIRISSWPPSPSRSPEKGTTKVAMATTGGATSGSTRSRPEAAEITKRAPVGALFSFTERDLFDRALRQRWARALTADPRTERAGTRTGAAAIASRCRGLGARGRRLDGMLDRNRPALPNGGIRTAQVVF